MVKGWNPRLILCCLLVKLPGGASCQARFQRKDELRACISQPQQLVDKKEDSLLEKQLILEEIASLSDRLRNQAAEGRQDTLELAQKVSFLLLQHSVFLFYFVCLPITCMACFS